MKKIAKYSLFLLNFSSTIYGQDVLSDDSRVDQSRLISPYAHKIPNLSDEIPTSTVVADGEGGDTDRDSDGAAAYGGSELSMPSPLSTSNTSTDPSFSEVGLPAGSPYPEKKSSSLTRTSSDISVWHSSSATLTLPTTLNIGAYGRGLSDYSSSHTCTNINSSTGIVTGAGAGAGMPWMGPALTTILSSPREGAPETSTCSSSPPSLPLLPLDLRDEERHELGEAATEDLTETYIELSSNTSSPIPTSLNNIIESELTNAEKAEQLQKLINASFSNEEARMLIIQWLIYNS